MQVLILIEVTADEQEATLTVNPWTYNREATGASPRGGSVEEAKATHEVLGQAITFAKMINGPERVEFKP